MKSWPKRFALTVVILPAGLLAMVIPFTACWFLGNWLWTTPAWWIGIPVRIIQWIFAAMATGFIIYWLYTFGRFLVTGKTLTE